MDQLGRLRSDAAERLYPKRGEYDVLVFCPRPVLRYLFPFGRSRCSQLMSCVAVVGLAGRVDGSDVDGCELVDHCGDVRSLPCFGVEALWLEVGHEPVPFEAEGER